MADVGFFGDIDFKVSSSHILTWKTLSRRRRARYRPHDVSDGKQKLQYIGLDLDSVELSILLDARYVDPEATLKKLDKMLEAHEARVLLFGYEPLGKYVLVGYREQRSHTDGDGNILWTEVSLQLKEYN